VPTMREALIHSRRHVVRSGHAIATIA
jgi:hypothetical protein